MLPRQSILFVYLVLQVSFTLLQHLQLRTEREDGILRVVFLLSSAAAEPAPHSRHGDIVGRGSEVDDGLRDGSSEICYRA